MSYKTLKGLLIDIKNDNEEPDFTENTVMFKFLYENKNSEHIPDELLMDYIGERNVNNQTPLMYATRLNNINFINELLLYDVGMIDDFNKSALDYAREFNAPNDIIDRLEEFEL